MQIFYTSDQFYLPKETVARRDYFKYNCSEKLLKNPEVKPCFPENVQNTLEELFCKMKI